MKPSLQKTSRYKVIALSPDFIQFAGQFDMIPEKLAERVLAGFVARRPRVLEIKQTRVPASRRRPGSIYGRACGNSPR